MKSTELLSPAGSLKAMRMALAYGANAVYAGQPRYSLRVRNNEFTLDNLAIGIAETHAQHKQFYVVTNLAPHNAKLKNFVSDMEPIVALKPDALIVSDPGVIFLLRKAFPDMPLHLSVQANTMNWAAVKFWQTQGISRVILSRELGLDEIAEIKQRCPEMELEVFVHGALCMAYSGRCLISSYMNKRDPNQGACTNACRWNYQPHSCSQQQQETTPSSQTLLVSQSEHPGELYSLEEDEHGSYLFNSRDLRAVQHVERLIKIGVNSLKIEGRTKSPYYVARTAQVYRRAIDAALRGESFDENLLHELDGLANRGYTDGFLQRHTPASLQNYDYGHSIGQQQVVGDITHSTTTDSQTLYGVDVKNKFSVGDQLLLMTPDGNHSFRLNNMYNRDLQPITSALGSGHSVQIPLPETIDITNAMLVRC